MLHPIHWQSAAIDRTYRSSSNINTWWCCRYSVVFCTVVQLQISIQFVFIRSSSRSCAPRLHQGSPPLSKPKNWSRPYLFLRQNSLTPYSLLHPSGVRFHDRENIYITNRRQQHNILDSAVENAMGAIASGVGTGVKMDRFCFMSNRIVYRVEVHGKSYTYLSVCGGELQKKSFDLIKWPKGAGFALYHQPGQGLIYSSIMSDISSFALDTILTSKLFVSIFFLTVHLVLNILISFSISVFFYFFVYVNFWFTRFMVSRRRVVWSRRKLLSPLSPLTFSRNIPSRWFRTGAITYRTYIFQPFFFSLSFFLFTHFPRAQARESIDRLPGLRCASAFAAAAARYVIGFEATTWQPTSPPTLELLQPTHKKRGNSSLELNIRLLACCVLDAMAHSSKDRLGFLSNFPKERGEMTRSWVEK